MTLVQLEYIIAVETYQSFVGAAAKCHVTQPTLSMQVQKLEESLGVRIFDRRRHPVVPTKVGRRIIEQARIIVKESQKITDIVQEEQGDISGELRIGVIPTVAPYLLPNVITHFLEKFNQLKLQIWEYTTERIVQELKSGTLDCGILSTPLHDNTLIEHSVYYETFVAYVSDRSPLFKKKVLKTEDVDEDKLWLLDEGHCMRGQVLNICNHKHNRATEGVFSYNTGSIETLVRMVDVNGGLTILPELTVRDYGEDQLQYIRYFKSPEPVREISIVTTQSYTKKHVIEILKKEIIAVIPERFRTKNKKDVVGFRM